MWKWPWPSLSICILSETYLGESHRVTLKTLLSSLLRAAERETRAETKSTAWRMKKLVLDEESSGLLAPLPSTFLPLRCTELLSPPRFTNINPGCLLDAAENW